MLFSTAGCKISVGSFFWFPYEDAAAGCECRPQLPRKSKAAFAALCRAGLIFPRKLIAGARSDRAGARSDRPQDVL
jgi:hypothetical protein